MIGTKGEFDAVQVQGEHVSGTAPKHDSAPNAEIESVLASLPNVAECAVLTKASSHGDQQIAYLVTTGAFSSEAAQSLIREKAPRLTPPDAYVLVTRLPFNADGTLAEAQLAQVPVVDESVAQALEAELLADPRVEHCAVFVDEAPRRTPVLHLTDLLPEEALKKYRQAATGAVPAHAETLPAVAAVGQRGQAEAPSTRPPALSIGADLARGPEAPRTLPEALDLAARRTSDGRITYLTADGATVEQSFHDLLSLARRICGGLQSRGLVKGQHVMLQLAHPEQVLPAFWGCLLGGFIPAITPIPTSYATGTNELERLCHIWQMLDAPVLVIRESQRAAIAPFKERLTIPDDRLLTLDALEASPDAMTSPELAADDVAFLVFTSGSTGQPKIIMLSHGNILSRSQGTNELCRHDQTDRILNWLPFDHIGSISDWHLRCVDLGCHMVYCSKEHVLGDPLNWLRLIDRFRITHSWAPNFAYALVNEAVSRSTEQWDLSSMKSLLTAGETVSSNTVHEFLRRLEPHGLARTALRPAYGMAELGSGVTYFQPSAETPVRVLYADRGQLEGALRVVEPGDPEGSAFTSLGPIIPGAGMRIVDDQGTVLPELTIGRLQISGGPVCKGYYRNPEANREVFVGDGWFNTGDRGFLAAGELYLTGRDKESLIINGANFHNSEIEAAVEEVAGVHVSFTAACAVRPRGEPEEQLAVFFSTEATGPALVNLLRRVQNSVARKTGVKPDYALPVGRDVIPKTAIGKIQRKQLTKSFESGTFADLVKKVDSLLENERTVPDWFLSPAFLPKAPKCRARKQPRRFLLVCDRDGLGEALERELERRGLTAVRVVRENGGWRESEAASGFTDVIHLAGYAPEDQQAAGSLPGNGSSAGSSEGISTAVARKATALLLDIARCTRGLEGSESAPIRHWVVSSNSQSVLAEDVVDPGRAAVPALLKALVQETPTIECRHLDLPFRSGSADVHELCSWLGSELEELAPDDEVAYRRGVRYVPAFTRIDWSGSGRSTALQRGGLYLVTGGLGGVGTALSRYLLEHWAARVLVVGRTALRSPSAGPAPDPGVAQKADLYRELEQLGTVRYRTLDVTDQAELQRAVEETEAELGQPLAGVFHLASAYHERPVSEETVASLASILSPKAEGAFAVHALLAQRPQAFVLCFSSLASVFSGARIAGYAAANRFLDAFCREQRRQGKKSYALNWSVWDGLGIGAASAPEEILRSKGYRKIAMAQGMSSLAGVLSRAPDQLLVGVDVGHPSLRRLTAGPSEAVARLRGALVTRSAGENDRLQPAFAGSRSTLDRFGQTVVSELWQLPVAPLTDDGKLDREAIWADLRGGVREIVAPETPLEHKLVEIWKNVLGLETLGVNEGFFELGGTSLLSVRLFAEIERHTGARLPPATLFQAATVRAMAELLEKTSAARPVDSIVVLAEASGPTALFLIHGADGDTARYRSLAQKLNPKLRVYGVEPFRQGRFLALHTRFEQMVSHCAAKIREVQPEAPYLIGGAAEGGVLAFEVACRLQAQGCEVGLVALFDSVVGDEDWRLRLKRFGGSWRGHRKALFDAVRVRLLRRYSDRDQQPPWFLELIPPETVYRFARAGHRPSLFRGRLTLFRASQAASGDSNDTPGFELCQDERLGWGDCATRGVDTIAVAGGHVSMLSEPNVTSLAEQLSAVIAKSST